METSTARIYALVDSRAPDRYRYVGKTVKSINQRLYSHMYRLNIDKNLHKSRWINSVIADGGVVAAVLLEECKACDQDTREKYWISKTRADGHKLTNMSDGGEGGINPNPEVREKISKALTGRKRPQHVIEILRKNGLKYVGDKNPNFGKKLSDTARAAISAANLGRSLSVAHVESIRATLQGKNAKLTESDVYSIFVMRHTDGLSQQVIANKLDIGQSQISRILLGKKWGHLNLVARFSQC